MAYVNQCKDKKTEMFENAIVHFGRVLHCGETKHKIM